MLTAQRIELLKKIVMEEKSVDIATLCSQLEVSNVTVRKYLDKLEKEGFLLKVHGGAMLVPEDTLDYEDIEFNNQIDEKLLIARGKIAKASAELVESGDSIFIGNGSTCTLFAKYLYKKNNLNVVTNNLDAAVALCGSNVKVLVLGGDLVFLNGNGYTCGTETINQLKRLLISKVFISADGINFEHGVTINDSRIADLISSIFITSSSNFLLADHTKFGKTALMRIGNIDNFSGVISDPYLADSYKSYFFDNNIKLITPYDI